MQHERTDPASCRGQAQAHFSGKYLRYPHDYIALDAAAFHGHKKDRSYHTTGPPDTCGSTRKKTGTRANRGLSSAPLHRRRGGGLRSDIDDSAIIANNPESHCNATKPVKAIPITNGKTYEE